MNHSLAIGRPFPVFGFYFLKQVFQSRKRKQLQDDFYSQIALIGDYGFGIQKSFQIGCCWIRRIQLRKWWRYKEYFLAHGLIFNFQ